MSTFARSASPTTGRRRVDGFSPSPRSASPLASSTGQTPPRSTGSRAGYDDDDDDDLTQTTSRTYTVPKGPSAAGTGQAGPSLLPPLSFLGGNGPDSSLDFLASLGVGKIDRPFRTPEPPPGLMSSATPNDTSARAGLTAAAKERGPADSSPALIPASRLVPPNLGSTPPPPPTRPPPVPTPPPAVLGELDEQAVTAGDSPELEGQYARQRLNLRHTMEDERRNREAWARELEADRMRKESFFGAGDDPVDGEFPDSDQFADAEFNQPGPEPVHPSSIPYGRPTGPRPAPQFPEARGTSVDEHFAASVTRRDSFFPLRAHSPERVPTPPQSRSRPSSLPKLQTGLPQLPTFPGSQASVASPQQQQQQSRKSAQPKSPVQPQPASETFVAASQPRQQQQQKSQPPQPSHSTHFRSDSDVYRQYQQETRASGQTHQPQQHHHQRGDSFFGLPAPPVVAAPHRSVTAPASGLPAPLNGDSAHDGNRQHARETAGHGEPAPDVNGSSDALQQRWPSGDFANRSPHLAQGPPGSQPLPPGATYAPAMASSSPDLAATVADSPAGTINWGAGSGSGSGSGSGTGSANNSASASIHSRPMRHGAAYSVGSGSRPPSMYNFLEGTGAAAGQQGSFAGAGFGNAYAAAAGSSLQLGPAVQVGPLLDHSHLKPGAKAKLLDHNKTLELYRANAKKTNDPTVMFEFACFLMDVVKEMGNEDDEAPEDTSVRKSPREADKDKAKKDEKLNKSDGSRKSSSPMLGGTTLSTTPTTQREREKSSLVNESIGLLQRLAGRGHVDSQFLLADCYSQAIGTSKGKRDFEKAFPLFVLAAKHGHTEATYRAGQCCENGWGTRKERDKAVTFYRKAAIAQYPAAMYRIGLAEMNGDLGLPRRPKEGVKWLKRAAECADERTPRPLHELALLHERGIDNVLFVDYDYAAELLARSAELGYAPSAYKLGECYEYGRMGCPQDSALSIHYYNIAAQKEHREACFALTAWYLVGSPGVLPQSDTEAYLWAKKAADLGLAKACYAVGYFTEVGMGTVRDPRDAVSWYKKAAEQGDKRAIQRLRSGAINQGNPNALRRKELISREVEQAKKSKEECTIM